MTKTIAIIDYGSGNLRSAARAFEHCASALGLADVRVIITSDKQDVAGAQRIVLPGQGAFGDCIRGLRAVPGMIAAMEEAVLHRRIPFLGICVGMQLLATKGMEHGEHQGLSWLPGVVEGIRPADTALKIPHMGWNDTTLTPRGWAHPMLRSVMESTGERALNFYFVHSFACRMMESDHVLAQVEYGENVTAIIGQANRIGVQFHPEKSHDDGLALIKAFMTWDGDDGKDSE